jgi:hypothetical protein
VRLHQDADAAALRERAELGKCFSDPLLRRLVRFVR